MSKTFKRITDQAVEAKGYVLYADENFMEIKVDLGEGANTEGIYQLLSSKGIIEGVDDGKIADLLEKLNAGEEVYQEVIAAGKEARNGKDGYLEFMVQMEPNQVEVTDSEGNVDFRDLNLIKEIHSGNPVLKVVPPDEGVDGINVQGKHITVIKGKKAKVRLGKNVRMDEDTQVVYATADGHVEFVEPLFSVQEEFVVNKDVDFTIGNLTFIGSLHFAKDIPPGYTMKAGKNIVVKGKLTNSNLQANGDITCEGGITGSEATKIECDGTLRAKFINEATVFCKGDVECYYEIVRSNIKALGSLLLENGAIRGGECYAFSGMKVKELGTPLGTPTTVVVGVDFSVDDRIEKLREAIQQLEGQKGKFQEAIGPFMKNKLLLVKAPEAKRSAVKTILNKIDAIDAKIKKVEALIAAQEAGRFNRTKQVEINGEIKDDVTIVIGNKKKKFDKAGKRKGFIMYDKASFEIVFSRA